MMNQLILTKPNPIDFGLTSEDLLSISKNIKEIERLKKGGEISAGFTFFVFVILFFSICLSGFIVGELDIKNTIGLILSLTVLPMVITCLIGMPIEKHFREQKINNLKTKIPSNYKLFLEKYKTWKIKEIERQKEQNIYKALVINKNEANKTAYKTYSLKNLIKSSGLQFEKRIYDIFVSLGFDEVILTPPTDDGGIDVIAHRKGYKLAIQCKAHAKPSGPAPVRELYGVMCSEKFDFGLLINPSGFSSRAMEFAKGKNIRVMTSREDSL